jgi:hypothetical protein
VSPKRAGWTRILSGLRKARALDAQKCRCSEVCAWGLEMLCIQKCMKLNKLKYVGKRMSLLLELHVLYLKVWSSLAF